MSKLSFLLYVLFSHLIDCKELAISLCESSPQIDGMTILGHGTQEDPFEYFITSGRYYWLLKQNEMPTKDKAKLLPYNYTTELVFVKNWNNCKNPIKRGKEIVFTSRDINGKRNALIFDTIDKVWHKMGYSDVDKVLGELHLKKELPFDGAFSWSVSRLMIQRILFFQGNEYQTVVINTVNTECSDSLEFEVLNKEPLNRIGLKDKGNAISFVAIKPLNIIGDLAFYDLYLFDGNMLNIYEINNKYEDSLAKIRVKYKEDKTIKEFFGCTDTDSTYNTWLYFLLIIPIGLLVIIVALIIWSFSKNLSKEEEKSKKVVKKKIIQSKSNSSIATKRSSLSVKSLEDVNGIHENKKPDNVEDDNSIY